MSQDNEETRRKAMETLSLQIDKYPRDLLRTFMSRDDTQQSDNAEPEAGSEEIELNLGLSLGGRFGVDKHAKKLGRSSSIVGTMPLVRENESTTPPTPSYPPLLRTSSLPTETEEEWRKRKELQTLRRMEAKRRRSEKQRNSKTERDGGEGRTELEGPKGNDWAFGLPMWASASSRQVVLSDVLAQGKAHGLLGGTAGFHGGGSSPGIPEMEGKPFQELLTGPESQTMHFHSSRKEAIRTLRVPLGQSQMRMRPKHQVRWRIYQENLIMAQTGGGKLGQIQWKTCLVFSRKGLVLMERELRESCTDMVEGRK
ncbi:ninja-family protein AFP2-like isoform X5 [Prosopis cineraria]|uniref:ninja-family protein AFP2-like isoform X5 n=1 Tax=Prosopis cineraria TaxID=364024 RepID=UPI0024101336|nr:ninja-family protein AFP2-like isoform X5 [Prosopis cineraria]